MSVTLPPMPTKTPVTDDKELMNREWIRYVNELVKIIYALDARITELEEA